MTKAELAAALEVPPKTITGWIRRGLPHARKGKGRGGAYDFDPQAVHDWLVAEGLADQPPPVVDTQAEAAAHFGVHERTFRTWLAAGCPGRPGAYDLSAIADWRRDQQAPDKASETTHRARLLEIRVEKERLALDEARGRLLPLEELQRWVRRYAGELRARIEQLPDVLLAELPPKQPRRALSAARQRLRRAVDDLCQTIADAVEDFTKEPDE